MVSWNKQVIFEFYINSHTRNSKVYLRCSSIYAYDAALLKTHTFYTSISFLKVNIKTSFGCKYGQPSNTSLVQPKWSIMEFFMVVKAILSRLLFFAHGIACIHLYVDFKGADYIDREYFWFLATMLVFLLVESCVTCLYRSGMFSFFMNTFENVHMFTLSYL